MHAFEINELLAAAKADGKAYFEFLRVQDLSAGLYRLAAGSADPQQPHSEDEVYYVIQGRGRIRVGEQDRDVMPGSVVYVAKQVEHRFHSITQDLTLLVFFAPAEYSMAPGKPRPS